MTQKIRPNGTPSRCVLAPVMINRSAAGSLGVRDAGSRVRKVGARRLPFAVWATDRAGRYRDQAPRSGSTVTAEFRDNDTPYASTALLLSDPLTRALSRPRSQSARRRRTR